MNVHDPRVVHDSTGIEEAVVATAVNDRMGTCPFWSITWNDDSRQRVTFMFRIFVFVSS